MSESKSANLASNGLDLEIRKKNLRGDVLHSVNARISPFRGTKVILASRSLSTATDQHLSPPSMITTSSCTASSNVLPNASLSLRLTCKAQHLSLYQASILIPPSLQRNKCVVLASARLNSTTHFANDDSNKPRTRNESGGERKVECQVEVISWRERRIKADILVNSDIESVWNALTDYERLADFIPNLVSRLAMTTLSYEVNVIPRFNFPAIFLERIIRSDLPINLQALACRAERCFAGNLNVPVTQSPSAATSMVSITSAGIDIDSVIYEENRHSSGESKDNYASSNFGPLSPSTSEVNSNWGAFGKFCKLSRPCMVDEVHLRRFDGLLENGGVHRCVFASITVKAPVREVWHVLTSYESLPEIVPNLAISKILSRENNKVRILQEYRIYKIEILGVLIKKHGEEQRIRYGGNGDEEKEKKREEKMCAAAPPSFPHHAGVPSLFPLSHHHTHPDRCCRLSLFPFSFAVVRLCCAAPAKRMKVSSSSLRVCGSPEANEGKRICRKERDFYGEPSLASFP
ncbi:hypothetical protein RJ639_034708 [Escallonia herrerae]|uniref:Coenzyme Q-binding protein COQ10 START domain-containing protein n=1 Tax=Escallonia herrerae TaxID=1293975 RepID=A0AA88WW34_9ASTE|nr:hypothetical protein RJ639_034708 [Escallonia herrerae]